MICDSCQSKVQVLDNESLWCPVCGWAGLGILDEPSAQDLCLAAEHKRSGLGETSQAKKSSDLFQEKEKKINRFYWVGRF